MPVCNPMNANEIKAAHFIADKAPKADDETFAGL